MLLAAFSLLLLAAAPEAAAAAAPVPAPLPVPDVFVTSIAGTPVGTVRLTLAGRPGGFEMTYESEAYVRRSTVVVRNFSRATLLLDSKKVVEHVTAESREGAALVRTVTGATRDGVLRLTIAKGSALSPGEAKGALPASLGFAALGKEKGCLPVVDETTGEAGKLCGARKGDEARGVLLGQPFVARLSGSRLERLELPEQHAAFERTDRPPTSFDPPDLMSGGVIGDGLKGNEEIDALRITLRAGKPLDLPAGGNQVVSKGSDGSTVVRWTRVPLLDERDWRAAREIAETVYDAIPDKRPGPHERLPRRVLREGRGACVAHTEAFLALAKARKLPARRALGLVAADGLFWPHEWVQVQVRGAWYDVDPIEGAAPALAARILFATGEQADEKAAERLVELVRSARIAAEPSP